MGDADRNKGTAGAEDYRREADSCRALAERSLTPSDTAKWLHLAEEWEKLAAVAKEKLEKK